METKRKNVFSTMFTLLVFISSMFASMVAVAPVALAANGLGEVTYMSIDGFSSPINEGVITVDTEKEIVFKIHNDEPVGGNCIDEMILTFPDSWQGGIDTSDVEVTNMGNVIISNEEDDGSYSGLDGNDLSIRIIPDYATNGVMLCPSGTTQITIQEDAGLVSPVDPELSTVTIMTSDEDHNEPSNSYVRQPIDAQPMIYVTSTERPEIRYVDFLSVATGTAPADYTINSVAKGAWGRLNDLYVDASAGMTVDVYVEKSGAGLQTGTDYKIASGVVLSPGINTISMSYSGVEDVSGQMIDGFIKDAEQGGIARNYYIDITSGSGTLSIMGHTDEDAAEDIDPTYSGTSYTNPPKEGTVLNVEDAMKRKILVQLVREDVDGRELDVKQDAIPIHYTTTLSTFVDASPRHTDSDGQVEIRLNPGTEAGNALVEVCYPDIACTEEDVAIAPGAPVSCAITKGLDTSVEAGSIQTIEATIYDHYGNVISNDPEAPLVTFEIDSAPDTDADLDDDTNPPFIGDGDGFEQEIAQFGIADVSLQTSETIGDNVVTVSAGNMVCGTTTVTGTLGQADSVDCEPVAVDADPSIEGAQITADQCFDVKVNVLDKNGNPLPKWESIVDISLGDTNKYINNSDLREEVIYNNGQSVKGKLNNNDPAYATIRVCGCDTLGTLDVVCNSDTLEDDEFTLDVINSEPECIDVTTSEYNECNPGNVQVHTSILDTCGNKLVDQECAEGGWASSCVMLDASCGELSSDKTCVDLRNTGMAPDVNLDMSGCGCEGVDITATDEPDCCASVYPDALPMCDAVHLGIIGPVARTDMNVSPEASNQDDFFVSERTVVELRQYDECDQLRECEDGSVDMGLEGSDCVDTEIQVDSPVTLGDIEQKECRIEGSIPLYKVVVENCADPVKDNLEPAWTDLPEKDDIVIDKLAFHYTGNSSDTICIYEETEDVAGFDPTDMSWGCRALNSGDQVKDLGGGDYIIELDTRVSMFKLGEYDNQRMGGAIVRPADTKDFYFVLQSTSTCGLKDIDYQYFQDYNSPDWIEGTPAGTGGNVRDTIFGSEPYTIRNDDYISPDPYPISSSTPDYGFGDRVLYNVPFINGVARAIFRDLVAEPVIVTADGMQKLVTFFTQPATQVVALNHDEAPQMACSDEGYDVNLQVTDGFQNQVGLATKVQLESCMTFPMYLHFRGIGGDDIQVNYWDHQGIGKAKDPRDVCFDMDKFKAGVAEIVNELMEKHRLEPSDYLASIIAEDSEFTQLIESMFDGKEVYFEGATTDEYGHDVVYTDANGQAMFKVKSDDASMFNIKWMDTHFRIFTIPIALDADYFDVSFTPGEPAKWDVITLPESGVVADGEQESSIMIRKLDACGNPTPVDEDVKVTAYSDSGRAIISRDFSGNNNYDNQVEGNLNEWTCLFLFPWLEDCSLQVMDDVIEDVSVVVEDANCEGTQDGFCTGITSDCEDLSTPEDCEYDTEICHWVEESICQESDTAMIKFVGAPRNLKITEIKHSDLLPADGFKRDKYEPGACSIEQLRECSLFGNEDVCFQQCTKYGGSGAWVTVEVQDKYGNRVQGYLGDGMAGDPGDVYGLQDNIFENICIALDDDNAFIDDFTFGWVGIDEISHSRIYCGDLAFGKGSVHVSYAAVGHHSSQPTLDPRETASVIVSAFDKCDAGIWIRHGFQNQPSFWDDECNGQEYNENNLPDSETASKLTSDYGQLDFVALPDRWDIKADRIIAAADGEDAVTLTINPENEYFDVRASIEATVQSSLLGSELESSAIKQECYVEGMKDPLNPTSIIVNTEACSGGKAAIKLTSTKAGVARITVTGNYYGCKEWDFGDAEDAEVYTVPKCERFGIIPMTPKTIEVEFKQSFQDSIVLEEGWNFFSVPVELAPSNDQWNELGLNTICDASAMWNDASQTWVMSLGVSNPVLEPMEGYWCHATEATVIDVEPLGMSGPYLPPFKAIYAGWNDIGLSSYVEMKMEHALISIDNIYSMVLDWVESLQKYTNFANTGELGGGNVPGTTGTGNMEAGQAYFIRASEDSTVSGQS